VLVTGTHENTSQVINTLYGQPGSSAAMRGNACRALPWFGVHAGLRDRGHHGQRARHSAEAVRDAQEYTWQTLKFAYRTGMGQLMPDRLFWAREEDAANGERRG
jgi:hydroxymethylpyrimidine/phosphomethylpyrimidine kinase